MSKVSIDNVEEIKASAFRMFYEDFKGNDWREAYFHLLSWKNTWGMAYELDMLARKNHKPFVKLVVNRDIKNKVAEMLIDLGYSNISCVDILIAEVEVGYDTDAYDEVVLA